LVEAGEASAEDFEDQVEVVLIAGAVDDGEGAEAQGGGHVAVVVAGAAGALDDDRRRGLVEAVEQFEEARAAFGELGGVGFGVDGVEGQAEIDDGDVDGVVADDVLGFAAGGGAEGLDAHGFEEGGQALDPGVGLPAGVGEEEVEAAASTSGGRRLRRGRFRRVVAREGGTGMEAHRQPHVEGEGKGRAAGSGVGRGEG
jgi:hypothetical protein